MSSNNKDDGVFSLGLFSSMDYSSSFLASYSAVIEHSINKNRCYITCQYLSLLSLASVLQEEISVMHLGGLFYLLMDNLSQ